ncbi:hypothetical protein ESCO_005564 [Escovopsis weberi]|uniref:Uncharacterized protein n=1 Tax=Escovopsis weberi TaxID=150374 RepID=A0A0M9VUF6_ESCWE|nr:hypothetical protein ESCO_005564 [Escovopsis weberi]
MAWPTSIAVSPVPTGGYFNGYSSDYEEKLLNILWVGIVGLEILMVIGVVLQSVIRRLSPQSKINKCSRHRATTR